MSLPTHEGVMEEDEASSLSDMKGRIRGISSNNILRTGKQPHLTLQDRATQTTPQNQRIHIITQTPLNAERNEQAISRTIAPYVIG